MQLPWWLPIGRVPEIEAQALWQWLATEPGLQIIDVRTPGEFGRGHISGARSVPIQSFRKIYPNLELDPKRPVVVICQTAHRSIPAVRILNSKGFDARQLAKGMNAWQRAKLPTVQN